MAQKVVPYYALVTLVVHNGVTEARGCPLPGGRALSPGSRRQGPASALSTLCSGAVRIPRAPPPGPPDAFLCPPASGHTARPGRPSSTASRPVVLYCVPLGVSFTAEPRAEIVAFLYSLGTYWPRNALERKPQADRGRVRLLAPRPRLLAPRPRRRAQNGGSYVLGSFVRTLPRRLPTPPLSSPFPRGGN